MLHGTSVFDSKVTIPSQTERVEIEGVHVYSLVSGLVAYGADFFIRNATDTRTCLAMVKDASEISGKLLDESNVVFFIESSFFT